ncbi:arginine deiminase family protein [Niabella insulamsoli]|uniref:arginine deiminase family protein n=1 Tax=Niabella insulamsoli TaxID=3144874 RepID=UPI0031FE16AD
MGSEKISVTSEIGLLKRVLVHSPDSGLGKVVPSKAQDWLFEDIVHLETIRRKEYDYYIKLLLYFLDPEKIKGKLSDIDRPDQDFGFYKPSSDAFYRSSKVIEIEYLLAEILAQKDIKLKLVASVCAIENCSYELQDELMKAEPKELAHIFITGTFFKKTTMLFPPVPNFIFTRDIGIVINDYILLNKPAKQARTREALLMKYIFFNHPFFEAYRNKIIELPETPHRFLLPSDSVEKSVTLEGGDIMVVSRDHVLIGVSERTSLEAAHIAVKTLFEKNVVQKVSVVKIPMKRDYMHIDTVFTQVKRNVWVMLGKFSRKHVKKEDADEIQKNLDTRKKEDLISIIQFKKEDIAHPILFDNLEDLLVDISQQDHGYKGRIQFIYSGNNEFPFDVREQWTDSCNLLALKEGVVLGYDRNDKTLEAFQKAGFETIHVKDLLNGLESGAVDISQLKDTFIVMPSAELSRARGGFHCMSMPLLREPLEN